MALKKVYIGSFGPGLYLDDEAIEDPDGDFSGENQQGVRCDGTGRFDGDFNVGGDLDVTGDADIDGAVTVGSIKLDDTDGSNTLELKWNEDGADDYVLNLLVGGGTRSLTLNENFTIGDGSTGTLTFGSVCTLTVELASILNQDLTTDADVTFATVNGLTLTAAATGFTVAGGTTPKTLTVDDNFVVSTQLAAIVANTAKATCNFTNVQTALAAATGAVDFNTQNLTGVGTIGCGTITTTGNLILPANGAIGVTDGNPQIVFDNANNWLEITGNIGVGVSSPTDILDIAGAIRVTTNVAFDASKGGRIYKNSVAGMSIQGSAGSQYDFTCFTSSGELLVANPTGTNNVTLAPLSGAAVGVGTNSLSGKLHVDQASTAAAIPVLYLDQADVSEEMIEFNTTIGVGNAIEAVGGKTLTTTHFIKVTIPGSLTRYIPVGTIA